jgi:hypothetical protein
MSAPGDTVFVALNRGDAAQSAVNLPAGNYTDAVTGDTVQAPLTLPPRTGLLLVAQ